MNGDKYVALLNEKVCPFLPKMTLITLLVYLNRNLILKRGINKMDLTNMVLVCPITNNSRSAHN